MLKQYSYEGAEIFVYEQEEDEAPELLQSDDKYKATLFYSNKGTVRAATNASYFSSKYVNGRNQGDLKNDTQIENDNLNDDQLKTSPAFWDLVCFNDGTYKVGAFRSWEYQKDVVAGYSLGALLIKDGQSVQLVSSANDDMAKITASNYQSAIAIADKKILLIKTTSITGLSLRSFILSKYNNVELLGLNDGGGSAEMIVNGEIKGKLKEGAERPMFNVFALVAKPQDLKCPFKKMCITQFDNGEVSHKGSDAWDISTGVAGVKAPYYAPCDVVCMAVEKSSASVWWQSKEKVKFADGTIDYMTIMCVHDNTINQTVGMEIKKGVQIGNMGDGGNAAGVHCHIEVAKGKYVGKYYKNSYGVYCLYNTCKFYDAFFMDDVEIVDYSNPNDERWADLNTAKEKFKYLTNSEEPTEPTEDIEVLKEEIELLSAQIKALESDKAKLEEEYSNYKNATETTINRLTQKLEQVTACANKILEIAEV